MNRSIEASGKTVKDAIQNGLVQLGCTLDEVETSVIDMGSPGLFGMFGKPAKVRLTVKENDHSFDIEMPVFTLDQPSKAKQRAEKKKEQRKEAPKAEEAEENESVINNIPIVSEQMVVNTLQDTQTEKGYYISFFLLLC